jgi:hypothetical protein
MFVNFGKFAQSKPINNWAFSPTPVDYDGSQVLVIPLTDGEIGRIIPLKAVGFSTMEISRMLSRNQSAIRSFP